MPEGESLRAETVEMCPIAAVEQDLRHDDGAFLGDES